MGCRKASTLVALLGAVALAACGEIRLNQLGEARCPTFEGDIQPLLTTCVRCHTQGRANGGYRLDDYMSLMERRDDGTPRVTPGDADSLFLQAARGELGSHRKARTSTVEMATDWIVRCRVAPSKHQIHPRGWATPTDKEEFHGKFLREAGYELDTCKECHGSDFRGGKSDVSCYACHAHGPLACNACHGDAESSAPPKDLSGARDSTSIGVGAHRAHVTDGPLHKAYDCSACHVTPAAVKDDGHYLSDGEVDLSPAEVGFSGSPGKEPRWDHDSAGCSNSYCHAPASAADTAATRPAPVWTEVDAGYGACGACHGLPPSSHADDRCEVCHAQNYNGGALVVGLHANGKVEIGDGRGSGCSACHGDDASPAPPRDTLGRTDPTLRTVGAHRAHLVGAARLRAPIECSECHVVPASVDSPGHIDHLPPAIVFPMVTGVGTLARSDGAVPSYDPALGKCSNVYCHGGGARLSKDQTPRLMREPSWTGASSQASCGSCHGLPPQDPAHAAAGTMLDCHTCHGTTILPTGVLKVTTDPGTGKLVTNHMNGQIDP